MAKFCSNCGKELPENAAACPACGERVTANPAPTQAVPVIVNIDNKNINSNVNTAPAPMGRQKNKWVAIVLCLLLGYFGGHKFYEGKIGMGILYLFTAGLFLIGVIVDFIALLGKPTYFYVP